jgi:hypothetical protein
VRHGGTTLNFPVRAGQEVVLQFATEQELAGLVKGRSAAAPK